MQEHVLHRKRPALDARDLDAGRTEQRLRALLAAAGIAVARIGRRPLSMEDVFVHYVTLLERGGTLQ